MPFGQVEEAYENTYCTSVIIDPKVPKRIFLFLTLTCLNRMAVITGLNSGHCCQIAGITSTAIMHTEPVQTELNPSMDSMLDPYPNLSNSLLYSMVVYL